MENFISAVNTVGFPIACVAILGYFVYLSCSHIARSATARENKLYAILDANLESNSILLKTNLELTSTVANLNDRMTSLSSTANSILDKLDLLKEQLHE